VRGDDQPLRAHALGQAGGRSQHDAVAERNDRALHVRVRIMTLGNVAAAFQQVRSEQPADEIQRDDRVRHAGDLRLFRRQREFAVVVLGSVVETHGSPHIVPRPRPMERGHRVHATGAEHNDLHAAPMPAQRGGGHKYSPAANTLHKLPLPQPTSWAARRIHQSSIIPLYWDAELGFFRGSLLSVGGQT
jgi:hypothetical protein